MSVHGIVDESVIFLRLVLMKLPRTADSDIDEVGRHAGKVL